ncbi:hypothetical protein B9Z55_004518 [Caenorhabditis nigoni]|uniref:Uncharacterized protein n=1 Tax=Caenorhabditis nigoni TaxID=1611254 RepID=A0A2G5UXN1_9PELO|nr:hypothetical protein B9Z55_004518 [Caenorhabditis nigoni]
MSGETGSNEALAPPEEIEAAQEQDEQPDNGVDATAEVADSDEGSDAGGAAAASSAPVARGRGRPPKGGDKKTAIPKVGGTGKRGRPAKGTTAAKPKEPKVAREPERKSERARKTTHYNDSDDSGDEAPVKAKKSPAAKSTASDGAKKRGRPKKNVD